MTEKEAIAKCRDMANEIEINMWILMDEKFEDEYKSKFRSIAYNMNDPKNGELRFALLTEDIKASKLPTLDSKQLAPTELKKIREAREEKHFKEQVLLPGDGKVRKILVKSKKGEEIIEALNYDEPSKPNEEQKSSPDEVEQPPMQKEEPEVHTTEHYADILANRCRTVVGGKLGEVMAEKVLGLDEKLSGDKKQ